MGVRSAPALLLALTDEAIGRMARRLLYVSFMSMLSASAASRAMPPRIPRKPDGRGVTPGTSGRILVIDDDDSMCQTLAVVLVRRGYTVEWRTTGAEALPLLDGDSFDVVVTDLHMDVMDGLAVCEAVRRTHPGLPVVVMSAFGTSESAANAARAGAWGFINKPFDLEELRVTLTEAVRHHRAGSQ